MKICKKFYLIRVLVLVMSLVLVLVNTAFAVNYLDKAKSHISNGEYKSAVIQIKNHLKENPDDAVARLYLSGVYLTVGDVSLAQKEASKAYSLQPDNENIALGYSKVLLLVREDEKVLQVLTTPFKNADNETMRQIYLGYAYLDLRNISKAKEIFSQLEKKSNNKNIYMGLAEIALLEQKYNKAIEWVDRSLSIDPENKQAQLLKAKIRLKQGSYSDAYEIYNQLLTKYTDIDLYLKRAAVLISLNKYKLAEKDVQKVMEKHPRLPDANLLLAQIKLQQNKYNDAKTAAQNVLNVRLRDYRAMLILGGANMGLGNYNQADKYLTQYLSEFPDDLKVQNLLANVYLAQKKGEQAILIIEGIEQKKLKHDAELLLTLGTAYLLIGEHKRGIELLNEARKLKPNNKKISTRLIQSDIQVGNIDNAILTLEKLSEPGTNQLKNEYMLVIAYIKNKEYQKAKNKIEKLFKEYPDNIFIKNLLAIVEKLNGNFKESGRVYKNILSINKQYIPAYVGLAELAIQKNNWDEAEQYYLDIISFNSDYLKAYYYLAGIAEKKQDYTQVEKYLLMGLRKSGSNVTAKTGFAIYLSKLYIKNKQFEKILKIANNIVEQHNYNKTALSLLVTAQILNKQKKQAIRTLEKIIANEDSDIQHRLMLASLLSTSDEMDPDVMKLLDQVAEITPNEPKPFLLKAAYLIKHKKYNQAWKVAEHIMSAFPENPLAYQLMGDLSRQNKNLEKAFDYYHRAYTLKATNKLLFLMVDILERQGKEQEKIELLKDNLTKNTKNLEVLYKLAYSYQEKQHYQLATKYYSRILNLKDNDLFALNNIAWSYSFFDKTKALEYAKKAYEIAPDSAAVLDTYGYINMKAGQIHDAKKYLELAHEKKPDNNEISLHLAECYYQLGKNREAEKILNAIIGGKNTPEKQKALLLLKKLN